MRTELELKSLELMKKFYEQYDRVITLSEDQYCHWDMKTQDDIFIEVKARRVNYNQFISYNKSGFIMENLKYEFLKDNPDNHYVNVFTINGKTFFLLWTIRNITPNVINMQCRSTTDFGDNNYRDKGVILLKAQNAYIFTDEFKQLSYNNLIEWIS